jgi:hypothetical protein
VANKVIIEGLVEGGEVKLTDRFYIGYSLVQCFKCYSYRYITKYYRIEARYSYYTGLYKTQNCNNKTKSVYSCCKARSIQEHNYKAWSELYTACREIQEQIAFCFSNCPAVTAQEEKGSHSIGIPEGKRE